ncbi:hypothetical protein Pmar_PMAR000623 [Perkinsus marinus ATCC 50983]|uniref:Uncharacterized protein n=1 Tax=Perkinsus marinus (strain ATCC 50983 / TXsc) TaxID=423536 RepID=C5LVK2_PERM5|nr:hypothetical protein Pmar_PMAR000623 [Perkinsus marinus ATCC 50983]EEQ99250.1 hypothetical protein Pmar_PMAR000623 [Perkinsus marinus ATCC 50983]|eukprot:XP_002766533.1 hypothetical protein Pmar_PMAR000623 [Perkinsus marinus ATCC 50983]
MDKLQKFINDTFATDKKQNGNSGILLTASAYVRGAIDWVTGEDIAREKQERKKKKAEKKKKEDENKKAKLRLIAG